MLKNYISALKNIFFPKLCFYCQNLSNDYLCKSCYEKIEFLYPPLCKFCSQPIGDNKTNICKQCRSLQYHYDKIISIAFYKEPLKHLIHLFKYKYYDFLAEFLAKLMIEHLTKIGINLFFYDLIISVPIHKLKLKEREYNQTQLLAKYLSNYFKISFKDDIIYEVKNRPSQTSLDAKRRQENIKDSFLVSKNLKGKKIILVDDIFTTGSTLNECSKLLKAQGAEVILGITLCKTPKL